MQNKTNFPKTTPVKLAIEHEHCSVTYTVDRNPKGIIHSPNRIVPLVANQRRDTRLVTFEDGRVGTIDMGVDGQSPYVQRYDIGQNDLSPITIRGIRVYPGESLALFRVSEFFFNEAIEGVSTFRTIVPVGAKNSKRAIVQKFDAAGTLLDQQEMTTDADQSRVPMEVEVVSEQMKAIAKNQGATPAA